MDTIVLDNSAFVELIVSAQPPQGLRKRVLTASVHVPEVLDAEFLAVIRRLELTGKLDATAAGAAIEAAATAPFARAPLRALLRRAWTVRHAVDAYDALYVALAEELDVPLLTCDARLSRSNGHGAEIELYPR